MALFDNFPYANFHEMNLDWIIAKVKELDSEFNETLEDSIVQYINEHLADIILAATFDAATHTITLKGE